MDNQDEINENKAAHNGSFNRILATIVLFTSLIISGISNEKAPTQDQDDSDREIAHWTRVVGMWTRGLVFVGVITAAVLALQLCILVFQVWTFIESERPVIGIPNLHINGNQFKAGVPVTVSVDLNNGGKTTAFLTNGRILIHWQAASQPLALGLAKLLETKSLGGPILANDTAEMIYKPTVNGIRAAFTQPFIDAITRGDMLVFVIGDITYKDEFPVIGRTSTTGFCYVFDPDPPDARVGNFARCGNPEYEYAK